MAFVMRDSAAWTTADGVCLRAFGAPGRWSVAAVTDDGWRVFGPARLNPDVIDLGPLPSTVPRVLAEVVIDVGVLVRWRSTDLWEAIATAIISQDTHRLRAAQMHHQFRAAYGTPIRIPYGEAYLMPDAVTVAALRADVLARLGMAFKGRQLQDAARAYLGHMTRWMRLPPVELARQLQTVRSIGPWTAGAAAADFTHDWSLYPYGDQTIRAAVRAAAPDIDWPSSESAFAAWWRQLAADQIGNLTLFTLAWGVRHGT